MDSSSSSRDRPEGVTAGSQQRRTRRLTSTALDFDLAAELASLTQEASWQRGDRNACTLVEEPGFRVVLIAAKKGSRICEHRTVGWLSLQAIRGQVRIHLPERTVDLPAGRLLVLQSGVPHDVEAVEEAAFLLTIARPEQV